MNFKKMRQALDERYNVAAETFRIAREEFEALEREYKANCEALDRVASLEQAEKSLAASSRPACVEKQLQQFDLDDIDLLDPLAGIGLHFDDDLNVSPHVSAGKGEIVAAIVSVLDILPAEFTWRNAADAIRAREPEKSFKDQSVRQAITRCFEDGKIELAKQGQGRAPSFYRRKSPPAMGAEA